MAKKKKKVDSMSGIAIGGIVSIGTVGAVAGASGNATASGISSNFSLGVGRVGSMLPAMGKIKGTGMVLGQLGNLQKSSKKLIKRRRRK